MMSPGRLRQLEALFHAARNQAADARERLLAGVDPELRREVESLLAGETDRSEPPLLPRPVLPSEDSTLVDLVPGARLGSYRIESKLGAGGMGDVYRAVDTRLGRAVAIKLVREQFSARFAREARVISSLNHPHICTLYDVGPNYLVMELIEGESLASRLQSGPLSQATALSFAVQTLAALEEAHGKGIIHRDLKPGNIMIAKNGIKILDFGLAKLDEDDTITASQAILGTPAYMAPEQREGKSADARADVYAFGCIFCEMLTGTRVSVRRLPLSDRRLEAIADRCLQADPNRRCSSAAELKRELTAIAGPLAAPLRPRFQRQPRALAAVLIGVGLAAGLWLGWRNIRHFPGTPALSSHDTLVLANFTNRTGDPVFDGTLRQGLSVQLEQSPFLSLVSDEQIHRLLPMMGQTPDASLTPALARDLCQRTASTAVLEGAIAQVGAEYLLTLTAVNCSSGATLASTEAQARDKNHVLEALGKTASEMRGKLGESLRTVAQFNTPLEDATTPSLEALKDFSAAAEAPTPLAITLYKNAIRLDPQFALAYAWLGISYTDAGEPGIAVHYTRKAYELRDRASEPERYLISAIYYKEATGELLKAEQSCQLWSEAYPRADMAHTYLAGAIDPALGRYEDEVAQAQAAIRLKPDSSAPYAFLMEGDIALGRLAAARQAYQQAAARNLHDPYFPIALYMMAFLDNDTGGMNRQLALVADAPAQSALLLAFGADTDAYAGKLRDAESLSAEAMAADQRGGQADTAANFAAAAALREALFGRAGQAQRRVHALGKTFEDADVLYGAALALAYAGEAAKAQALADLLRQRYPAATLVRENYLPTLAARIDLDRRDPSAALKALQAAVPYEFARTTYGPLTWSGLYPVYVRGEAYLAAHDGGNAATQFLEILNHRGIILNSPLGALARLQLGRAYAMQGNRTQAAAAYRDFLELWRHADGDIPVLRQARREAAALNSHRPAGRSNELR